MLRDERPRGKQAGKHVFQAQDRVAKAGISLEEAAQKKIVGWDIAQKKEPSKTNGVRWIGVIPENAYKALTKGSYQDNIGAGLNSDSAICLCTYGSGNV